ncbi:hypothetical protein HID58_058536 [Brassica napus]|uniref:Uncharacterized protein n=1 Tax=Brassica napus TaxID=3708 RepID=A0ABQ7ZQA0_BRANA|nr:hypothetical protein HID58_058536 [Brassica napus]
MLKQESKRQSTSTPASFRRLEEHESRDSTEQGSDKLVTEDFETTTHQNGLVLKTLCTTNYKTKT